MGDTTHVTLRIPNDELAYVDAEAKRLDRSRSWVIANLIQQAMLRKLDTV
jgi:predicted transcriptional regulator